MGGEPGEASMESSVGNGGRLCGLSERSTRRRQAARSLGLMDLQRSALRRNCSRSAGSIASNRRKALTHRDLSSGDKAEKSAKARSI